MTQQAPSGHHPAITDDPQIEGQRDGTPEGTSAQPKIATPDGKSFEPGLTSSPLRLFFAILKEALRLVGRAIMTIWRLAGALDEALWQGVRLIFGVVAEILVSSVRFLIATAQDLVAWLPSRWGRAYTAFSGVILIISSLWILDELKEAADLELAQGGEARPPVDLDDPILARIDGRYVRLSEVKAVARASGRLGENDNLTAMSAFERGLVESFVEQRLLARAALNDGLAREPAVAQKLIVARDRILAAAYMDQKIDAATTDEVVSSFYTAQADVTRLGDEVRAQHIVVTTEEEATEIRQLLEGGATFETLARERSIDRATAPLGGELGYFTKDMMTPALANAAFTTPKGSFSPIFFSEFGWHVLRVLDRRRSSSISMEQVQAKIEEFLAMKAIDEAVDELSVESNVIYYQPETRQVSEGATPVIKAVAVNE
ncbi:MAG: peptidylprolyl isomerase [Pseudomonadota bacterium]